MTLSIDIGKEQTIGISEEQLATMLAHEAVKNRIVRVGLKNILSDANASIGKRDGKNADGTPLFASDAEYRAAALAASMKTFDAMLKGEVRAASSGPRAPSDPVGAEALRMARVKINGLASGWEKDKAEALANIAAWATALGLPNTNVDERKAIIAAAIAKNAARDDVREAAKAAVEAKAKVIAKVDVSDIL